MSCDLGPQELLGLGEGQIGANNVQALDDLVTGNLNLIDQKIW